MRNYRAIAEKLAIENVGLKRQLEGKDVLIASLVEKVYSLEDTIKKMEEEMGTLKRMHFGTSSEKTHSKVSQETAEPEDKSLSVSIAPKPEVVARPKRKRIYNSVIESCKLCKIDPYKYLCEIFTRVPKFGETWDDLLPCNIKM